MATGRTSCRADRPIEWATIVCETNPRKPSTVLGDQQLVALGEAANGSTAEAVARARRESPRRLARALRGDLDNIVLMALAQGGGSAVRVGRPVCRRRFAALGPTAGSRARATALAIARVASCGVIGWRRRWAFWCWLRWWWESWAQRRRRSERGAARRLLRSRRNGPTGRPTLRKASLTCWPNCTNQPLRIRWGDFGLACRSTLRPTYNRGASWPRRTPNRSSTSCRPSPPCKPDCWTPSPTLTSAWGESTTRRRCWSGLAKSSRAIPRPRIDDVVRNLRSFAWLRFMQGRYREAEPPLRKVLAIYRATLGESAEETLQSKLHLAICWRSLEVEHNEAEALIREVIDSRRKSLGPEHPRVGFALLALSLVHASAQQQQRAIGPALQAARIFAANPETTELSQGLDGHCHGGCSSAARQQTRCHRSVRKSLERMRAASRR